VGGGGDGEHISNVVRVCVERVGDDGELIKIRKHPQLRDEAVLR
jgi:hypothetical protein